jgi:tetratricopeptide (TPR) repeat protein
VLLSDATFRLARDAAEVETVEPLVLKGKSAPIAAFRLTSVRAGAPAFTRRLDSPMVGRERERELLRQAFERARDERACHLFTILGPAGIGKSRLVGELVDAVQSEATVVSGRCLPYGEGITYWPLLEILDGLQRELELGAPEETAWAARKLFEEVADERALVVVLDDMNWAEPTFLDLVEHVADLSRDAPILLVCVARSEFLDARPAWGGGKLNATTILLEPLSGEEIEQLVANLLERAELPADVLHRVEEAAEGNPLFVEEMLAMIAEDGRGGGVEVPPTIQALLAARLDRLEPAERDVLGRASIEGKVFHAGGVAVLVPDDLRPDVRGYLISLVRKELIRADRPVFEGEDAFRFRHLLIRDAAYGSLPKEERADLHERFAGWLDELGADALGYDAIAGYHFEQAHRYRVELGSDDDRVEQLGAAAASRLGAAGVRAARIGDIAAAVNLLRRAVSLRRVDDPARILGLCELGEVLGDSGQLAQAKDALTEAVERSARLGLPAVEARAQIALLRLRMFSDPEGRAEEQRVEVERLLMGLERLGDDRVLARAWRTICETHLVRCEFDDLERAAERQFEHAKRDGEQALMDDALFRIAQAVTFGRTPVEEGIVRLLAMYPQESVKGEAALDCGLGALYAMAGRYTEGRELFGRARERLRELGLEVTWAGSAMMAGYIELYAGDPLAAEGVTRAGCERLSRIGERSLLSTAAVVLAEALYELGREDEAELWTRTAEEAGAGDDLATQVGWRAIRAKVFARRGELPTAEALAHQAVELGDCGQSLTDQGSAYLALAEVLRLAGREREALAAAGEALRRYEQKGVVGRTGQARAFIAGSSAES